MMAVAPLDAAVVEGLVAAALHEDAAALDLTTAATVPPDQPGRAQIVCRASGVICGLAFAEHAFQAMDPSLRWHASRGDGDWVEGPSAVAEVTGSLAAILRAERVALNFLQRLSGTATLTRQAVDAARGSNAVILDTRKTTPGLRAAERYAVRAGGGVNHRDNLGAGILIKDNHVAAVRARGGALGDAVRAALQSAGPATAVEVEVRSLEELEEALAAGARSILLDNFPLEMTRQAATRAHDAGARVEASGGITADRITEVAATGVDFISLGALTHSAPALDIALDVVPS